MKGFTTVTFALLASATLGFGQINSTQPPSGPVQRQQTTTYPAQSAPNMILPGTINYLEGQVLLNNRRVGPAGPVVMQPGQILTTSDGFAEVLLTPGALLRVGHNSQVRLITSGLSDTKAQLDRGSAIVEVDQLIKGTNLAVVINGATAKLEKKGLYDFDVDQQAVRVLDGKVKVFEAAGSKEIGKNDQLLLSSTMPLQKSSFDVKALKAQPLYVWSAARSQEESQANVALAQNVASYGGWAGAGWYWDPYWSFYSYLPGDGFLYSPFGWGFYSPAYIGFYGVPFGYGRFGHYGGRYGHVSGMNAHVSGFHGGGMGGFHGGGGGGFHGGGGGGHR